MTHVFVVDETTFKYHLEYLFAGTGAKDKSAPFLANHLININSTIERMLIGMIADISRISIGDKIIFYLQATKHNQGMFFGVFKVISNPFFDENDDNNYLKFSLNKGLTFRVLIAPDKVYAKGITEHEYLDSLQGKNHPYDLCWSMIYRKLKGNRGCTMLMDYEYEDLINKLNIKNNNQYIESTAFTYDPVNCQIVSSTKQNTYLGRQESLNILPRLIYKYSHYNAFEAHLQAYILQNYKSPHLYNLLSMLPNEPLWIGNEVACGVGMQKIDIMIKQENEKEIYIRLIELKDEAPYDNIVLHQIPWYLEWLSNYVLPRYNNKIIHVIPTIIAKGNLSEATKQCYENFSFNIINTKVEPLQYIGFDINNEEINFTRFL